MSNKLATSFTDPAVAVATVVGVVLIAIDPSQALLVLCAAEFIVGAGCATHVRTSLTRTPPAPPAAALFAGLALFWLTMAGLSLWWYVQGS